VRGRREARLRQARPARRPPVRSVVASEQVFVPQQLARVLGIQYAVGGLLALAWVLWLPADAGPGRDVVLVLAVLAEILGAFMAALSIAPVSDRTLDRAAHACILSAQAVIAIGYAASQDPETPLALFMLWTTPYAGIFSRRARWAHVATTTIFLGVASLAMPAEVAPQAAAEFVFVLATVLVATLLVSRITQRLHVAGTHDALTGLPNRRLFQALTRAALTRRAAKGGTVLVLLIDLDRFKDVNDSYGHAVGDQLLELLAPRLQASLRSSDVVARLGGDEFAVLCQDPSGAVDAEAILTRLLTAWATEPVQVGERRLYASASVGVVVALDEDTPETLLRNADTAMYEAKAAGGSCWRVFDPGATGRSQRLVAIEQGLREAAARDELELHYQPVLALAPRPVGVEGLLRWTSPELGQVAPDEFIPVAERSGAIAALGLWVLDRALRDLAGWRRSGVVDEAFSVAVNVSALQLTQSLPGEVAALLAQHRIPAANLGLEITESAMMTGEVPGTALDRLHELGVTLLLDDFGTGYSSMSHLRRFPLDVVKIDRSFVSGMVEQEQDHALVMGALSLAHALGMTVVAEGIEDERQLLALHAAGCDAGQGYGLSRPVPADRVEDALGKATAWALEHLSGGTVLPPAQPLAQRGAA